MRAFRTVHATAASGAGKSQPCCPLICLVRVPKVADKLSALGLFGKNQNGAVCDSPRDITSANMGTEIGDGAGQVGAILKWIRPHEEEMARVAAELVAIASENPPGKNYQTVAKILEKHIRKFGFDFERFHPKTKAKSLRDSPACLLAECGRGVRTLYFHGHYDVVPAQTVEQFKPLRKKHFLFGRGACDMKGGIVAMLYGMRALKECGLRFDGKIGLMLVPDEETGGERGSAWLWREGLLGRGGLGMLTAEPTSGKVWHANRGAISLRVEVRGKAAHVGLQHRGENAFERMHRVVERLLLLKQEVESRRTGHSIGAESEFESATEAESSRARGSILMIGGQSGGGTNFNVVPERCWFTVDRRINPEEDLEAEKERLIGVLEECKRCGIPLEWEILQEGESAACCEEEHLGRALASSIAAVAGNTPRFEMCPGLLETRFYAALGMPAYAYGPGLLSVAHGPKEYVDMRRVAECAAIYALTAMKILSK
jgi:succinyl-diaminopimelate desuccinylase